MIHLNNYELLYWMNHENGRCNNTFGVNAILHSIINEHFLYTSINGVQCSVLSAIKPMYTNLTCVMQTVHNLGMKHSTCVTAHHAKY